MRKCAHPPMFFYKGKCHVKNKLILLSRDCLINVCLRSTTKLSRSRLMELSARILATQYDSRGPRTSAPPGSQKCRLSSPSPHLLSHGLHFNIARRLVCILNVEKSCLALLLTFQKPAPGNRRESMWCLHGHNVRKSGHFQLETRKCVMISTHLAVKKQQQQRRGPRKL